MLVLGDGDVADPAGVGGDGGGVAEPAGEANSGGGSQMLGDAIASGGKAGAVQQGGLGVEAGGVGG